MLDHAQLRQEILTDPLGLNYAAPLAEGNDAGVAALLNAPRAGTTVFRDLVPSWEILSATTRDDLFALSQTERQVYGFVIAAGTVDMRSSVRDLLASLFPAGSATRPALVALARKANASRAEALFGVGVVVGYGDVSLALRGM